MIPKVIHYCWFGRKEKPADVIKMIQTWRNVLPDYEIIEWNEDNFDVNALTYTREAYATHNYAFVSDVCRLKVLYDKGGIYLDTDIDVLHSFNPFLSLHSFIGMEYKWIGTGVIGAEANCKWIARFLKYYDKRHFINPFGHCVRKANTKILTQNIIPQIAPDDKPAIHPVEYFCANDWSTGKITVTDKTVCIHRYARSWSKKKRSLLKKIAALIFGMKVRYGNIGISR